MEGRTKFNYGFNSSLMTIKDIDYMLEKIDSNLDEEQKSRKDNLDKKAVLMRKLEIKE